MYGARPYRTIMYASHRKRTCKRLRITCSRVNDVIQKVAPSVRTHARRDLCFVTLSTETRSASPLRRALTSRWTIGKLSIASHAELACTETAKARGAPQQSG